MEHNTVTIKDLDLSALILSKGGQLLHYTKRGDVVWFTLKVSDPGIIEHFYAGRATANVADFMNHRHNLYRLVRAERGR